MADVDNLAATDVLHHIRAHPERKFIVFARSHTTLSILALPFRFERSVLMPFVLPEKERKAVMAKLDELKPDILLAPAFSMLTGWYVTYDAEVLYCFDPTPQEKMQGDGRVRKQS